MSEDMKSVLILISTYNGGEKIKRQIDSILEQKVVDVSVLIRDDGSDEQTKSVLKTIAGKYAERVQIIYRTNVGWKKSFMDLIQEASLKYDYYGFSDQDDIWMPDKLISCIHLMEEDQNKGVKLAHCNALSVDEDLKPRDEQEKRIPCPPNYKAAIATEYFQGCGMVWNREAMELLQSYKPQNKNLAHDYWVGLVCYLFGKIYFCEEPKFFHIRYGNNESCDGNVWKGRLKRISQFIHGDDAYMNPANDLLAGFGYDLNSARREFIEMVSMYKSISAYRLKLIVDKNFKRPTVGSTILLKIALLLKRY